MQSQLKWWLAGIVFLTLLALLVVLKPITLKPRIDASTHEPLKAITKIGPFYINAPIPDLRLGLDLRGGMQLRLQLQKSADFIYEIKELLNVKPDDRPTLQGEIGGWLPKDINYKITVGETQLQIRTTVKDENEMKSQDKIITEIIRQHYPDAAQTSGSPRFNKLESTQLSEVQQSLENRINYFGVAEAIFQAEPPDKILVELPGVKDPNAARALLQSTSSLEFRAIPRRYVPEPPVVDPNTGNELVKAFRRRMPGDQKGQASGPQVDAKTVLDEAGTSELNLGGNDIQNNADIQMAAGQETSVTLNFKKDAARVWGEYTSKHIDDYVAIVLDNRIISCPVIRTAIVEGATSISGGFDGQDGLKRANALKISLNAGALPVNIKLVEEREVSATYGEGSLHASLMAGGIGFLLIIIFMIAYYRLPGALASLALIVYIALLMAVFKGFDATLTLPGIFGVILSVGMAVDANVIIFERLKEELRSGKTLRTAIDAGFKRAWTAILDANVCSMLTGMVLYWLGTGPVKGFAITLVIGVAVSLFTAVTVTRLFMDIIAVTRFADRVELFGVSQEQLELARAHR
jgi:preprotein translocase subunit SecD